MFKLLILTALWSAVTAELGVYSTPLAPITYDNIAAPATISTYVQHSGSYVTPTVYPDIGVPHILKKRSPGLYEYVGPDVGPAEVDSNRSARLVPIADVPYNSFLAPSLYIAPPAASYIARVPITYSASVLPVQTAHFIKKRSAESQENSALEHDIEKRTASSFTRASSIIYPGLFGSEYFPSAPFTELYSPPTLCSSYKSKYVGYPATLPYIKK